MSDTYFDWLRRDTPSRVWINNPTRAEVGLALAAGAVATHVDHDLARHPGGDQGAVVLLDDRQRQVDSRRHPGARQPT